MAKSAELIHVIDQFRGINTSDDEVVIEDGVFLQMDNFYIDGSPHEIKVRPGFIEIGEDIWPVGISYLSRYNTYLHDSILGFPADSLGQGAWRRDFDGWITRMQDEVPTGSTYHGRITTSAKYINKEYFYSPGLAKAITWSIDLAANNTGGASDTTVDIYLEQTSYVTSLQQDEANNPNRSGVGVYTSSTLLQTATVSGIIGAYGANTYHTYTGTLTLNANCFWARLSIRLTNAADPVGNKRIRVKNPSIRSTNYSTQSNRIRSSDFSDFTHNWSRRVVTPSANPVNEIQITAGNLATQTSCTVTQLGNGAIELYPDVAAKISNLVNIGVEVTSTPLYYHNGVYTHYMNFNTFAAPPFLGVHVFKDRVWGFNEEENRLWFSDVGDPTGWPTVNFIDIGESDSKITGLYGLNDKLIIFKDDSVWFLYVTASTTTWNLRKHPQAFGCSSHYTIKQNGEWIYFVMTTGVGRTDGNSFELLSDPIKNVFNSRTVVSWNSTFDHAGLWRDHYIVSLRGDGTTTLYVFNTILGIWYTWTTAGAYKLGYFVEDELQSTWGPGLLAQATELVSAPAASQRLNKLCILPTETISRADANMIYADSDNPYNGRIYSKSFNYGDFASWKRIKFLDMIAEGNAQLQFQSIVDGNSSVVNSVISQEINTSNSTAIPGPSPVKSVKAKINAMCKTLRLHLVVVPRLPNPYSFSFITSKNMNGYGTALYNTTVGSLPYETARPLLGDGLGYKMAGYGAIAAQTATLVTPYISALPNKTLTIVAVLSQLVAQANNSRYIYLEEFNSSFVNVQNTTLANNTAFSGVTDTLTYTPTTHASTAYIRITFKNNHAGTYWYLQSLSVTPDLTGATKVYTKAKISLYSLMVYLHKMRNNIKALT